MIAVAQTLSHPDVSSLLMLLPSRALEIRPKKDIGPALKLPCYQWRSNKIQEF